MYAPIQSFTSFVSSFLKSVDAYIGDSIVQTSCRVQASTLFTGKLSMCEIQAFLDGNAERASNVCADGSPGGRMLIHGWKGFLL